MDKQNKDELLQKEIDEELIRLKKDEKLVKVGFVAIGVIFLLILFMVFAVYLKLDKQILSEQKIYTPAQVLELTPIPATTSAEANQKLSPTPRVAVQNNTSLPKEYFIPFGSGTSSSNEWTDVEGLEVTVDLGSYGKIKDIKFEASIQVPGNNQFVSVRLFNKTDKHPVWNSEITKDGGDSSYVVSSPIIYDTGTKTYKVQMKTQLGSDVTLGEARLHVYTQ